MRVRSVSAGPQALIGIVSDVDLLRHGGAAALAAVSR